LEIGGLVGIRKFKNYFKRGLRIQYEIRDVLAIKICKDLGIPRIK